MKIFALVTSVSFSVQIYDDSIVENIEIFLLYIHDVSVPEYTHIGDTNSTTVTILDNDCEYIASHTILLLINKIMFLLYVTGPKKTKNAPIYSYYVLFCMGYASFIEFLMKHCIHIRMMKCWLEYVLCYVLYIQQSYH